MAEIHRAGGGVHTFEDGLDAQHELLRAEGLGQVVVGAGFEALDAVFGLSPRGEHDDRGVGGARVAAEFPEDRVTVTAGQHEVEKDQIRSLAEGELGAIDAVMGLEDFVARALEVETDQVGDVGFVLND